VATSYGLDGVTIGRSSMMRYGIVSTYIQDLKQGRASESSTDPVLKMGDLEVGVVNRQVRVGTARLRLTVIEQSLLFLLAANAGKVLSRDEILDALWGMDFAAESNVVDRHIRALRGKLQDDWHKPRFIATVPGRGYRFIPTMPNRAVAS
jgi:two-component system KDP operon response regulator KdpE